MRKQKTAIPASDSQAVIDSEREHIAARRRDRFHDPADTMPWCGIGLSGGGIRSASLALGVLQALSERGLLQRFDYISSVSGGGYIAGSLQWWWLRGRRDDKPYETQAAFGVDPGNFPYGPAHATDVPEKPLSTTQVSLPSQRAAPGDVTSPLQPADAKSRGQQNLKFLRAHSAYLIPGNGLNAWSMLGVLFRTIVISLLTWLPVLTLAAALIYAFDLLVVENWAKAINLWSPLGNLIPVVWSGPCGGADCTFRYPAIYAILLHSFYAISILFVFAAALFSLISRSPQNATGLSSIGRLTAALACVAAFVIAVLRNYEELDASLVLLMIAGAVFFVVAVIIIVAELMTTRSLNSSYWLRRTLEWLLGNAFIPSMAILAIATIPLLPHYVHEAWPKIGTAAGIAGLVGGVFSALYGYYTFLRNIVPSLVAQIAATIGALAYLYVTLALAFVASAYIINVRAEDLGSDNLVYGVRIAAGSLILLALAIGLRANINYVGLHRFYRDRLMEAFMPSDNVVTDMKSSYSPVADGLTIADLMQPPKSSSSLPTPPRPYPIVNANAILVNDPNRTFASRGGDNFIMSPLFVGSDATGWQKTDEYIQMNGPLTLASVVAASGAAASASAGYIGTGITMNPLVSAVMSLLNIRLGLWVGNPYHCGARRIKSIPTFFNPGLISGIFGRAHRHDSGFIELTDGGHFENLALYELIRRQVDIIVVVDGEADPTISLSSLVSATRRIEQDFGATLTFFPEKGPELLMMVPGQGYPSGVRYAQSPFIVAQLTYRDGSTGTLIYLKATLIRAMDFTTAGYLAGNPAFPHQSTVDQFFDPDQFDAYRFLGYRSALEMIDTLDLSATISDPKAIVGRYQAASQQSAGLVT